MSQSRLSKDEWAPKRSCSYAAMSDITKPRPTFRYLNPNKRFGTANRNNTMSPASINYQIHISFVLESLSKVNYFRK